MSTRVLEYYKNNFTKNLDLLLRDIEYEKTYFNLEIDTTKKPEKIIYLLPDFLKVLSPYLSDYDYESYLLYCVENNGIDLLYELSNKSPKKWKIIYNLFYYLYSGKPDFFIDGLTNINNWFNSHIISTAIVIFLNKYHSNNLIYSIDLLKLPIKLFANSSVSELLMNYLFNNYAFGTINYFNKYINNHKYSELTSIALHNNIITGQQEDTLESEYPSLKQDIEIAHSKDLMKKTTFFSSLSDIYNYKFPIIKTKIIAKNLNKKNAKNIKKYILEFIDNDSGCSYYYSLLALSYSLLKLENEVLQTYEFIISNFELNDIDNEYLGKAFYNLKQFEKAKEFLNKISKRNLNKEIEQIKKYIENSL